MRWLVSLIALACCASANAPPTITAPQYLIHDTAQVQLEARAFMRFGPPVPEVYLTWWQEVEACTGKTRDIREITWYLVNRPSFAFRNPDGEIVGPMLGGYFDETDEIFVGLGYETQAWLIRHEMVHAIMRHDRNAEHPDSIFRTGPCAPLLRPE